MKPGPLTIAAIEGAGDRLPPRAAAAIVHHFAASEIVNIEQLDDGTFELRSATGRRNVDVLLVPGNRLATYLEIARRDRQRIVSTEQPDLEERLAAIRPRAATPNIDYERRSTRT